MWGWAAPGALVTVELTKEPAEEEGVASDAIANGGAGDADGIRPPRASSPREPPRRRAPGSGSSLPPQPASHGPFTLRILARSGDDAAGSSTSISRSPSRSRLWRRLAVRGQSNMQFTVAASFDAATHIAESATVEDGIRIATVAMTAADVERARRGAAAMDPAYAKNGQRSAWAKAFPDAFNPRPRPIRLNLTAGGETWAGSPRRAGSTAWSCTCARIERFPSG